MIVVGIEENGIIDFIRSYYLSIKQAWQIYTMIVSLNLAA